MTKQELPQAAEADARSDRLPVDVAEVHGFLKDDLGIWCRTSRNEDGREVYNCREAADGWVRTSEAGTPLWDEMKTKVFRNRDASGFVMVHCRGDRELDPDKVELILGYRPAILDIDPKRIDEEAERIRAEDRAIAADLGMSHGLVNPFKKFEDEGSKVVHYFDSDLLVPLGTPGTVMTNASHLAYGVEFDAQELFGALLTTCANAQEVDVVADDSELAERRKWVNGPKLGLLSGNTIEAGSRLKRRVSAILTARFKAQGIRGASGDTAMPDWFTRDVPSTGLTMKYDEYYPRIVPVFVRAIGSLCIAGAQKILNACNTTAIPAMEREFIAEIARSQTQEGTEFLSMPRVAAEELKAEGVTEIGLIAAEPVLRMEKGWSAYEEPLRENGISVKLLSKKENPAAQKTEIDDRIKYISDLANDIKDNGTDNEAMNRGYFSRLHTIMSWFDEGSTVLIALTEISDVYDLMPQKQKDRIRDTLGITIRDSMDMYAERIADYFVSRPEKQTTARDVEE